MNAGKELWEELRCAGQKKLEKVSEKIVAGQVVR